MNSLSASPDGLRQPVQIDYWKELDRRHPQWQPHAEATLVNGCYKTMDGVDCGLREGQIAYRTHAELDYPAPPEGRFDAETGVGPVIQRTFSMGYFPYVRAIDPSGGLHSLCTSTTREARDGTGYDQIHMAQKRSEGWLIAERGQQQFVPGGAAMSDDEYGRFLFAEMKRRKQANERKQREDELIWTSRAEREALAAQERAAAATEQSTSSQTQILAKLTELVGELVSKKAKGEK